MEIIPQQCLSILPFLPEAVSSWSDDSDILHYLRCLFDKRSVLINGKGVEYHSSDSDYGNYIYERGKDKLQEVFVHFLANARKARGTTDLEDKAEKIPNFWDDNSFGLMGKYYLAWEAITGEVLSESAFFSIEHILESESELNCSVLLASNLYYKQALQILRNFLEDVVVQLFFCDNEAAFADWKGDLFRVPQFRGRNGMISNLSSRGIIPNDLAEKASGLYGELNGCIHGAESRLVHGGIFTGEWSGLNFNYARFEEWCQYFSQCVNFAIYALRIHINTWEKALASTATGIRCTICHALNDFDIQRESFAGHSHVTLQCKKCGNRMTFSAEWVASRGIG